MPKKTLRKSKIVHHQGTKAPREHFLGKDQKRTPNKMVNHKGTKTPRKSSAGKTEKSPITPETFWKGLKTKSFGRSFYSFSEVTSTNDIASQLIEKGAPEGTLVTAEAQTRGRGRQGRVWTTSQGKALAFSLVLKPRLEIRQIPGITLAAAVAVAKTLEAYGLKPQIKWPNDLLLKGKKVCGILTEMGPKHDNRPSVILGIGMNLNQAAPDFPVEIRQLATSVYRASGRRVDRVEFLQQLMKQLETVYGLLHAKRFGQVLAEWRQRSVTLGQRVKVTQATQVFEGTVVDLDASGFLLVRRDQGQTETVHSGDIEILKTKDSKQNLFHHQDTKEGKTKDLGLKIERQIRILVLSITRKNCLSLVLVSWCLGGKHFSG